MDVVPRVRPEYGPSLPELLRRRLSPGACRALAVVAGLVALALVGWVLFAPQDMRYIHRSEPVFNLRWREDARLKQVKAGPGVSLQLEARRGGRVVQSFSVAPFELPRTEGEASAALPLVASARVREELAPRFEDLVTADEGKARINDALGYQMAFEGRSDGRPIVGREVLLFDPEGDGRTGVVLTMFQEPGGPVQGPGDVGAGGSLQVPYRSFRFGTEWPT